jgi:hypothetical protein
MYKAHVYRVTKCADLDSWLKIKIKIIHFYLTFSPPSEISRTAVDQLSLPYTKQYKQPSEHRKQHVSRKNALKLNRGQEIVHGFVQL